MEEGSGHGSGRVGSDFLSAIAGRVESTYRRVGSGPRKVTRGQLCDHLIYFLPMVPDLRAAAEGQTSINWSIIECLDSGVLL